ncbi:hypothetical protein E4U53_003164 [Claviceps sorghi]|nr:hypothetical protein E4U53_003164 [Claviceps sorghi]
MVATRSRTARPMDERPPTAASSSNRSRDGRKRGRSEFLEDTNEDVHAEPKERGAFSAIIQRASIGETSRKKSINDNQESGAVPEEESPSSSSSSLSRKEKQEHQETSGQIQSPEPQYEGQPDPAHRSKETTPLKNEPEMHAENITRIIATSVDMEYIEPEPEGVTPVICSLDCSGINDLIPCMKRRGWTSEAGDWSLELLALHNGDEAEKKWTAPTQKSDSRDLKLFLGQTIEIGNFVHAMPKNPESQSPRLRECSMKATLCSMRDLAEKLKQQVQQARDQASKANEDRNRKLVESMRTRLVPLLVLVLKEALLLGGSSRICEEKRPERIGPEKGNFMACTLQFPLRIISCIDQLWPVIQDSVDEADRRKMFWLFDKHLSALRKTVLDGMNMLKEIARRPQMLLQMKENDERIRKLRDEETRRRREELGRRLRAFTAWTHQPVPRPEEIDCQASLYCYGQENEHRPGPDCFASTQECLPQDTETKTGYLEKYGWKYEDDLTLMRAIRRVTNLTAEDAAQALPGRTVTDVRERMVILKARVRTNLIKAGKQPAEWCY